MTSGATSTRMMWPHARSKAAGEKKEGLPDAVDADQLMRELEDFLPKQRESGISGEPPR